MDGDASDWINLLDLILRKCCWEKGGGSKGKEGTVHHHFLFESTFEKVALVSTHVGIPEGRGCARENAGKQGAAVKLNVGAQINSSLIQVSKIKNPPPLSCILSLI